MRISNSNLLIISVTFWLFGIMIVMQIGSFVGAILIHLATIGYTTGVVKWGQANKGDDSQVSFWNKTETKESVLSALGRGFRLGMGFFKVLFIPIVIASNWIPYSAENTNSKKWVKTEEKIAKELDIYHN